MIRKIRKVQKLIVVSCQWTVDSGQLALEDRKKKIENRRLSAVKLIIPIFFLLVNYQLLLPQVTGYAVIMQGKIIESSTGKPVATSLMFINEKGKKWESRSNSKDGTYQQPLNFGSIYEVIIKGYLPLNNHLHIDLTQKTQYEELTNDIYVKSFEPKIELFKYKFFEPNDSIIINKPLIQIIKNFIDYNPEPKLNIVISSYDSWFNNSKRKIEKIDKKGKKSYKTETYSTKEQLSDLLDSRINSLRTELKNNEIYLKKEAYIKDLQVIAPAKKQMKRSISGKSKKTELYTPEFENVRIIIGK